MLRIAFSTLAARKSGTVRRLRRRQPRGRSRRLLRHPAGVQPSRTDPGRPARSRRCRRTRRSDHQSRREARRTSRVLLERADEGSARRSPGESAACRASRESSPIGPCTRRSSIAAADLLERQRRQFFRGLRLGERRAHSVQADAAAMLRGGREKSSSTRGCAARCVPCSLGDRLRILTATSPRPSPSRASLRHALNTGVRRDRAAALLPR